MANLETVRSIVLEAWNKTVTWAEQAWLRRRQGIRSLLIDDVAEQYKHVEYQMATADSVEGCFGGMKDGVGKMKKKEKFWGRELFM